VILLPPPKICAGASFGGKLWIPKIYDGKNKTFFSYYGNADLNAPGIMPCHAMQYIGKIGEDFTRWLARKCQLSSLFLARTR